MKKNKRKKKKKKKNPLVKPNDRVRECVCTQLSPGAAPATTPAVAAAAHRLIITGYDRLGRLY